MKLFGHSFFKKKNQEKKPIIQHVVHEKKVDERNVAEKGEDFFIRSVDGKIPKGHYVVPTGKGFATRNEKKMILRKQILEKLGLRPIEIESVLNLIRIEKAAKIASDARGFTTEVAAKNCLHFVKQREIALAKIGDKKRLDKMIFAREAIEFSLGAKQPEVEKAVLNEFNMGHVDVANSTHYIFHPNDNRPSRILQTNFFAQHLIAAEAGLGIETILGEKFSKFADLEHEGIKGL
ncbi:MAG: hypothetical protein WC915_01440 [archaeon]|jgi:hypothetical protein